MATSVVLVGPERWRIAIDEVLGANSKLAVAADVEGNLNEVDIYGIPQGDVVLIAVDGERPTHAIELAMRLQAKDRGTGIAMVLPRMQIQNLRAFYVYAGSWSLISASVCGDPVRLGMVLESTGRGIPWVDPVVGRLLKTFERGTADFDQDFEDSAVIGLMRGDGNSNDHSLDGKAD